MSADPSAHRSNGGRRRFRLFRKCLFGYNPIEVHEAIDARDSAIGVRDAMVHEAGERALAAEARVGAEREELQARRAEAVEATRRIDELEHVAARLATMVVDRDRELRRARAELQAALERDDDGVRAFAAIAEDLEMVRRRPGHKRRASGCGRFARRRSWRSGLGMSRGLKGRHAGG